MPSRHKNMLKIEIKEMKRRLLDLEIKVAVQQVLLKTCNEASEADDEEIYLCKDESLYDEEIAPVDQANDDELYLYEGKPIFDEEVMSTDQADDEETYLYEGEPIYDEEVTPPDQEELLVFKQNLHTAVIQEEPLLCCNNFHTHYAFQGKACNMDNGNYENIVSNYMVQKLKSPMLDHLHPQWLNTESEVTKCESLQGVTSFSDVLADKISFESPPVKQYYNDDADQRAKEFKKLYEQVRDRIQKQKHKTKRDKHRKQRIFNVGNLVWIYLRFLKQPNVKLSLQANGPFNIVNLSPYFKDDVNSDSRSSPVQSREHDTETESRITAPKTAPKFSPREAPKIVFDCMCVSVQKHLHECGMCVFSDL